MTRNLRNDGPIIHLSSAKWAIDKVHAGPAICRAGYGSLTEGDQNVTAIYDYVTCRNCQRIVQADNRREDAAEGMAELRKS